MGHRASRLGGACAALAVVVAAGSGPAAPAEASAKGRPDPGLTLRLRTPPRMTNGDEARMTGRLSTRSKGQVVKLEYRPAGSHDPLKVDETETDKQGRFELTHDPRYSGSMRAYLADRSIESGSVRVEVAPALDLDVERHSLRGEAVRIAGELSPVADRRGVVIERAAGSGRWARVRTLEVGKRGTFATKWEPNGPGQYGLRARFAGDRRNTGTARAATAFVYRKSEASYYGPGFYGARTACGGKLKKNTLGVAHKTVPCGKKVTFRRGSKSVRVPVIDRGPFVKGREWDLTRRAADKIGLVKAGTGRVLSTR